jgi:hypothetical protein
LNKPGQALKPMHDWVMKYQSYWSDRFNHLDLVSDELKHEEKENGGE